MHAARAAAYAGARRHVTSGDRARRALAKGFGLEQRPKLKAQLGSHDRLSIKFNFNINYNSINRGVSLARLTLLSPAAGPRSTDQARPASKSAKRDLPDVAAQAHFHVVGRQLVCSSFASLIALTRALRARRARPPEVAEKGSISGVIHGTNGPDNVSTLMVQNVADLTRALRAQRA